MWAEKKAIGACATSIKGEGGMAELGERNFLYLGLPALKSLESLEWPIGT